MSADGSSGSVQQLKGWSCVKLDAVKVTQRWRSPISRRVTRTRLERLVSEIEAWIAIAEREDVPLIIGLKSIEETHDFMVNFRMNP